MTERTRTRVLSLRGKCDRKTGGGSEAVAGATDERVPRVARLMALAIHLDRLLQNGQVINQAELARLGHVSRPRVTQVLNLLNLAPDVQEAILFLPGVAAGRDPITERDLRPIAATPAWPVQRRMWRGLESQLTRG